LETLNDRLLPLQITFAAFGVWENFPPETKDNEDDYQVNRKTPRLHVFKLPHTRAAPGYNLMFGTKKYSTKHEKGVCQKTLQSRVVYPLVF
jgi:hypothetical protein